MRHRGRFLNQDVERGSGDQFATVSANLPSTTPANASPAQAAAQSNPHRRPTTHQPPRVLSSEAFGRRPRHGCTGRRPAGIRNPSRERPTGCAKKSLISHKADWCRYGWIAVWSICWEPLADHGTVARCKRNPSPATKLRRDGRVLSGVNKRGAAEIRVRLDPGSARGPLKSLIFA